MKDFLGQELKKGDSVVFSTSKYNEFTTDIVLDFNEKYVKLKSGYKKLSKNLIKFEK